LKAGVEEPCLAMVVDPEAAVQCHRAGAGAELDLEVGHRVDPRWGQPLRVLIKVLRLAEGRFCYTGGILGGTWASMGPSAVVGLGRVQLLISSLPTYDWAYEQYSSVGLDPAGFKFVGVKNMMNFRTGYRELMKGFFVLDLPGPTPADMRALPFCRVQRPLYPLDPNLETPRIATTVRSC
jgi:microcystin degradation protein MlrC